LWLTCLGIAKDLYGCVKTAYFYGMMKVVVKEKISYS